VVGFDVFIPAGEITEETGIEAGVVLAGDDDLLVFRIKAVLFEGVTEF